MTQIANIQARLDFTLKTIEFDHDPTLTELNVIQESLSNWEEWRVVVSKPVFTVSSWCYLCQRSHISPEVCPSNGTWITTTQGTVTA